MQHRCVHVCARAQAGSEIWNVVYRTSDMEDAADKLTELWGY